MHLVFKCNNNNKNDQKLYNNKILRYLNFTIKRNKMNIKTKKEVSLITDSKIQSIVDKI